MVWRCLDWGLSMGFSLVSGGRKTALAFLLTGTSVWAPAAQAETVAPTLAQLQDLSIEELAQVEVTSVSKRAERLSEAPAAIYVIGNEDILRSAATSLPEVLRLAPNLQLQQIDSRQYAISARGFNGYQTANKMLALIDGRSIYTPLFSAIFWELHSPVIEDIEQVEVVSGPGGTLYGPNAVNGVISITTKSARDTLGGLARATVAANEQTAAVRYGVPIGNGGIRFYGNYFYRGDQPEGAAPAVDDGAEGFQGGFRMDLGPEDSAFTLQGAIFDTNSHILADNGENGHNVLARWVRQLDADSSFQIQAYYDDFEREFTFVRDALETFDATAQYNGAAGAHHFVLGAGVRTTRDEFVNNLNPFILVPERKRLWIANAFAQDEVALSEQLSITAGIKLEQSSFSGVEVLPNLRLAWQPSERTLLWSAVSRAVRTPSRIDRQLQALPILAPAMNFESEELTAIEAGYRGQPTDSTNLSVSVFYNLYDHLRTTEFAPGNQLPIRLQNGLKGHTYGIEAWATQQVMSWWRLKLGVATLAKHFEVKEGHVDITNGESAGNDPDFRFMARSQMSLADNLDLDLGVRAVDDLDRPHVDGYVEADARLAWRVSDGLELYVAGRNLLHEAHKESFERQAQLIERSVFAGTRLLF